MCASATGTNEVVAIDESTLRITARMPGGTYPDGMAYAPQVGKLYVSDETGRTETVIDVRTNQRITTIPLDGEVGNTQYDAVSGHIFVNVQSRRQLVEIDPATVAAVKLDTPDKAAVLDGLKAAQRLYRIRPDLALVFDLIGRGIDSVDALSAFLRRTTPSCA